MTTHLTRWQGSTDPAVTAGTATFTVGGQSVSVGMCHFQDALALAKLMKAAADAAAASQAQYLRGAINRILEDTL